jgi:hypothetical protein
VNSKAFDSQIIWATLGFLDGSTLVDIASSSNQEAVVVPKVLTPGLSVRLSRKSKLLRATVKVLPSTQGSPIFCEMRKVVVSGHFQADPLRHQ